MKKSFPTKSGNHKPARVIDSMKGDIKKYLKRERTKKLPEGTDFWDFNCRVGLDADSSKPAHVKELNTAIDELAKTEPLPEAIYIEILAIEGIRRKR